MTTTQQSGDGAVLVPLLLVAATVGFIIYTAREKRARSIDQAVFRDRRDVAIMDALERAWVTL